MGNHERYALAEDYCEEAAARVGIRFLRKEAQILRFGGATLNLAGVDHQSHHGGREYLVAVGNLKAPDALNLLALAQPGCVAGGRPAGIGPDAIGTYAWRSDQHRNFRSGDYARAVPHALYLRTYRAQDTTAYVTRGIGTIGIPARIGAPPEITVIPLEEGIGPVRYLILTDIHANWEALEAVTARGRGQLTTRFFAAAIWSAMALIRTWSWNGCANIARQWCAAITTRRAPA